MSIPAYLYTIDKSTRSTRLPTQAPIRYTIEHAAGTRIEADNAAPLPLDECILQMLPQQSYNGYDRPWAGGTGKNISDPSRRFVFSGATLDSYDDATSTFTLSGSQSYSAMHLNVNLEAGVTYTFSANFPRESGARIGLRLPGSTSIVSGTLTRSDAVSGWASFTYTPEETREGYRFALFVNYNSAVENTVTFANCMVEVGSERTSFAPYENACPLRAPTRTATLTVYGPDEVSSSWSLPTMPASPVIWGYRFNALSGELVENWNHLAVYDRSTYGDVGEPWMSSLDVYVPGTQPTDGAEVAWDNHVTTGQQLQPWDVRTYQGDNLIELPDGELTVAYTTYGDDDPPEALDIMIDLKEPTDVLHPTVVLNLTGNPTAYNYMFIPEFNRFYWLTGWTSENLGLWSVSADVDVLASWRSPIMDLQLYVLRAAAAGDGRVIDHMYPAIADVRRQLLYSQADPWGVGAGTVGTYVVSVCGSGETSYYAMSPVEYKTFFAELLGDDYVDDVMSYLPNWETIYPAAKLEINALQYIAGVKWFPMTSLPGVPVSPVSSVPVGYGAVNTVAYKLPSLAVTTARSWTIPLSSIHPQSSRGTYLNLAPYSSIHAYVPPFGVIAISPATAAASGSVTMNVSVDLRSGDGALRVLTSDGSVETELHAAIGVSVAIGQTVNAGYGLLDATGAAAGVVGGIAGAIGSFATGNVAGGVGAVAGVVGTASSAIGNAISSQIPTTRTVGSPESIGALRGPLTVYSDHYMVAPEDVTHRGRPLCQVRRLGDLPGYVLVADADFMLPCMQEEHDSIRAMLEGGVFVE